ncbi:MAG TPA: prepilin-type N-terminal cleavage/methylation domain-containing protein [Pyrinomonadaceae bacterium]|nr:prepilin-type N-terminal cleavage/methylation domain-containing protein [Pyrinomonadaceae bacterium]
MRRKNQPGTESGFSLIELLIVVAIIGIIAAIGIPQFLAGRQAARAASAVSSLRIIFTSQISYRETRGSYGTLADLAASSYLRDPELAAGAKSQYLFVTAPGADPARSFTVTAAPVLAAGSYHHYFCDQTGVVRFAVGAAATAASQPIQ